MTHHESRITKSRLTLATLYGVGLVGFAPGTAGSAVAAVLAYFILLLPHGWLLLSLGVAFFTWAGTHSATRYMVAQQCAHDPGEIIVDELAGQWLTYSVWHVAMLLAAPDFAQSATLLDASAATPLMLVAGFFLFRAFDIIKPWPISWADREIHGGWGVMFDDLLAAIPAGICLYGFSRYAPQMFALLGMAQ